MRIEAGNRIESGSTVAARLYRVEAAIDAALAETAAFVADLPRARSEAYLSAVAGQQVFDHATESLSAINQARARMVAATTAWRPWPARWVSTSWPSVPWTSPRTARPSAAGRAWRRLQKLKEPLPNTLNSC